MEYCDKFRDGSFSRIIRFTLSGLVQEIAKIGLHFCLAQETLFFKNNCPANEFAATFTKPACAG
jgi:hypothetical protein